ncbi:MAG: L,D-transpeptidase [Rhizobacter sp.]|nr:L,D-transpeptidase [Bacteriovorax sp.]
MKFREIKFLTLALSIFILFNYNAFGQSLPNILDDLDPRDPNIEAILQYYDEQYYEATGNSAIIDDGAQMKGSCYRDNCPVWLSISKDQQLAYLYIDGEVKYVWKVSTGRRGYTTPNFDINPNGRVYDKYSSITFPGGDYNGLGNMPYAVFISGGYAVHGTTAGNWPDLGKPTSHGCVRLHPDNAFIFNRLVRANGVGSVWITVAQ